MDKRKNNRGHKGKAGRKSKAEEQKLVEKLSPLEPSAFKALADALNEGASWAVKMFFEYKFGKPKETKDITVNTERPIFNGLDLDVPADNSTEEDSEA